MASADRRQNTLERAAVDRAEALALAGRVGDTFDAVAIDEDHVQLRDPAVRAPSDGRLPVGREVRVRLVTADPVAGVVRFTAA